MREGHALRLLDLRAEAAVRASGVQVKDALRAEAGAVLEACAGAPREQPVVLYCDSPGQEVSQRAAAQLLERGFTRVAVLAGGFLAWQEAGLPLQRADNGRPAVAPAGPAALPAPRLPDRTALAAEGEFRVGVKGRGPYFNARATRVGTTAVRLEAPLPLAPDERVRLEIFLTGEAMQVAGRVVAVEAQGGGSVIDVALEPLSEEAAAMLEGFILSQRTRRLA